MSEQFKENLINYEQLPLKKEAELIGRTLSNIETVEQQITIEADFTKLQRIGEPPSLNKEVPKNYLNKKNLFSASIDGRPVIVLHYSGQSYGQDANYFQRLYNNARDIYGGKATQFTERKIAPSLLGYDDQTMTLLIEKAQRDLGFYLNSTNETEIKQIINNFNQLIKKNWEESKKEDKSLPRYVDAFLKPEYNFLKEKKIENYFEDSKLINLYKKTQNELVNYSKDCQGVEKGFGLNDVKPSNLVEDKKNILFIDIEKPGYYHWLSMLGQFYQGAKTEAPNSCFTKLLKKHIVELLHKETDKKLAFKLFSLGRMNRLLIPCTLRNIVFASEIKSPINESNIKKILDQVNELINQKSIN
jgi:hypothetical protein